MPNFRALGPRLGAKVQEVRAALAAGDYDARRATASCRSPASSSRPASTSCARTSREGFEAQTDGSLVVAIDTRVTEELALEGTARDVVRFLQNVRKELGFDVSDRIAVRYAANERGVGRARGARRVDRARGARASASSRTAAAITASPPAAPRSRFAVERA